MAKLDRHSPEQTTRPNQDEPVSDLRGRDLVYVDIDDDITSIVGKIKASSESVVALVPPKRVGVLQSVVNLKLLQRATKAAKKRLAVVTTDEALVNLAAGLNIPVAKNVNAQAVVPEVEYPGNDDDIDIIDGNDISVGELSRLPSNRRSTPEDKGISAAVSAIETDDRINNDLDTDGPSDRQSPAKSRNAKGKIKVPNVNSLRKKVLLIGALVAALVSFLVWAIMFAPQAVITIKAKTSPVDISKNLSLSPAADRNTSKGSMSPVIKQKKSNESLQFEPTGSKEVGDKATGTVAFCYNVYPFDPQTGQKNTITIKAGTRLYANGMQFTTDSDLSVGGGRKDNECGHDAYVGVKATAVNIGAEGNIGKNTTITTAGYDSNVLIALARTDFTGGSKQTVKVVQQSDVDAVVAKLKEKGDADASKSELTKQMSDSTVVIKDSFTVNQGNIKISPAVGETASGQATASMEITYTLVGVNRDDLSAVLTAQLKEGIDTDKQKIYSNGLKEVNFSGFTTTQNGYNVLVKTVGHVGPVIDEDKVKQSAVGKKAEEIKALLKQTDGVSNVEVTLTPFWVNSAPSAKKIIVNYTIDS